ncbi:hypothetical protein XS74_23030 [Salmonella enterica subsp. enterica]|nr:hypothetical protein [Salmonella enterica subsp. enterica]EDT7315855.1 hypothetical protein [Salmonella enterica subsp. enterica]
MADSLIDLTSVELRIQAASGSLSPKIYANGRNQLKIEVIAKAYKTTEDNDDVILNIPEEEWRRCLSLCHADSDEKLVRQGDSGWCFTDTENEYCREIPNSAIAIDQTQTSQELDDRNAVSISFFLYTDDININRIAVRLDLDDDRHFTTSDLAIGSEKMAVPVTAITPFKYDTLNALKVTSGEWQNRSENFERRSQVYADPHGSWIKENCVIRLKEIRISLNNGYTLNYKEKRSSGIPPSYEQLKWLNDADCDAIKLTQDMNGGYLNAWYVEPASGAEIGYASYLNSGYKDMNQAGWPSFYFSGEPSGEYDYGVWVYWPRFSAANPTTPYSPASASDEQFLVYCYQLHIPNTSELYWGKNCPARGGHIAEPAIIYFIDNYGNENTLTIEFNNDPDGGVSVLPNW